MTTATVVLVAETGLDIAAARRLADYGELDDAGVARALEQVHVQRWGRADLPGHLTRIDALAAVVDDGVTPRLIRATQTSEAECLEALFRQWPLGPVDLVDWNGSARSLLAARALAHDRRLPGEFAAARVCALDARAAPAPVDHPAPAEQVELECLQLMAGLETRDRAPDVVERAIARYRLWLRWLACHGRMNARTRAAREARLAEIPLKDGA
ncbi:hypothetical protein [Salinisphaera hydrothermalis]|uniref:hypothetical protein n=1 Tax=Salinisphaera hydrothermalis TaxID=563188 RepID=UPI00334042BB